MLKKLLGGAFLASGPALVMNLVHNFALTAALVEFGLGLKDFTVYLATAVSRI